MRHRHYLVEDAMLGLTYGQYMLERSFNSVNVDMVFDVGANVGQYGQMLRTRLGYAGPIVSFEPVPDLAKQLRAVSERDRSWMSKECALDEIAGMVEFNVMQGDEFSSLLDPHPDYVGRFHGQHVVRNRIEVPAITLSEAFSDVPEFSRGLLKLDTQGSEARILRGGSDVLGYFSLIQIELGFSQLYAGAPTYGRVIDMLSDLGYSLCAMFPNNEGHFPRLLEMDAIFIRNENLPELD